MKKSLKRITALLLAVIMMTALVGCGEKDSQQDKENEKVTGNATKTDSTDKGNQDQDTKDSNNSVEVKEPISLTYWSNMNKSAASVVKDLGELEMFKELEKQTGVTVEFLHPPADQAKEQFNLMIASRELPDVIVYNWLSYPGGPENAIDDGIIIPINDLLDSSAPNLASVLKDNPDVDKQVRTDSGTAYGFPALTLGDYNTFGGLIMRQDWLDDLGLDVPETMDEWTNVLRKFRDEKGATAPFTSKLWYLQNKPLFMGAYGVGYDFYMDNGTVKYGPMEEGYREYLTTFNTWYEEGLLDPDFASIDGATVDSQILNDKTGAFFGYIGGGIGKYLDATTSEEFDLVAVQYPVVNKGDEPEFVMVTNKFRNFTAAITTACENPEEVAAWLDYMYSEEGHMLKNFGLEGLTYTVENGEAVYTDLIMNNPDGLAMSNALAKYMQANYPAPGMDDDRYLEQYYVHQQQKDALGTYAMYADNASNVLLPPVTATPDESDELASLYAEIKTYKEEMELKFIMGIEPMENFDRYVEQLKSMQVERVIELKQAALDRYNNR